MDRLGVILSTAPPFAGGRMMADYTYRCQPAFTTGERGFLTCAIVVPISRMELVQWSDRLVAWLTITYYGQVVWEGRVEDFSPLPIAGAADMVELTMVAYGGFRAYSDLPYTAIWSATMTSDWKQVDTVNLAGRQPGRYQMDTNDRLYIAPSGGEGHELAATGSLTYAIPHGSSRQIVAISFDYSFTAPNSTWIASLDRRTDAYGALTIPWSIGGNGATQTGTQTIALTACDRLLFNCYFNRAATTLGTAVVADTTVAVTPGSMTGIVKASLLSIGGADPEQVEVTAVTATTFTAHFRNAHGTTDSVTPVWDGETGDINLAITNLRVKTTSSSAVYADEILRDLATHLAAVNPTWVSTKTGSIQSPALDLRNETYLDMTPMVIVEHLLTYGDAAGNVWEFAIWEQLIPVYRIRGSGGRTWYMDVTPAMERTLDTLYNSAYATYSDPGGVERRTATTTNALVNVTGITRRMAIGVDTDGATQAGYMRDIALADSVYGGASGDIPIPAVYDVRGNRWPLCMVRAGDIIVARNLPVASLSSNDRGRAWVISATAYDGTTYPPTLTVSPERRAPRYAAVEARRKNQL